MSKRLVSFNPGEAYALMQQMMGASGISIPSKAANELVVYIVENMDMNMALASAFWDIKALSNFAQSTGVMPNIVKLDSQALNLVMNMLQPVGLALFSTIYQKGLFKINDKDTFPYVVVDVNNTMVVLEEDTYKED